MQLMNKLVITSAILALVLMVRTYAMDESFGKNGAEKESEARDAGEQESVIQGDTKQRMAYQWFKAVRKNNVQEVKRLLENKIDVNMRDMGMPYSDTALHKAVLNHNIELVTLLLVSGAEVNMKSRQYNNTAMYFAVANNNAAMVEVLIACGAYCNPEDRSGGAGVDVASAEMKDVIREAYVKRSLNQYADWTKKDSILKAAAVGLMALVGAYCILR